MENISLYDYIERLKQTKENLHTLAKKLRYEGVPIETIRKEVGGRISKIDEKLDEISRKYAIDYKKLIQIISKQLNKKYKLKCFREIETVWEVENGSMKPNAHYTGRHLKAFITDENNFFNSKENDLGYSSLTEIDYSKMLKGLNETNSIVLNSSEDFGPHRMFVLDLAKDKNYMQIVTHDYRYYNDFYSETTFKLLDIISEELKQAEYKQEDTTSTENLGL